MHRTRIKICCISSVAEARLAVYFGCDALGLVSSMPSGPGVIPEPLISEIASKVPPAVMSVLLSSKQTADEIIEQHRICHTAAIQIVDRFGSGQHHILREALPGIKLIQVIHVNGREDVEEAKEVSSLVDGILLDSGNQNRKVKTLGGTGETHDWDLSREIVAGVTKPVFLAGGLNPENIRKAIESVNPYGIDVCSGVRSNGKLDRSKLSAFIANVRSAKNTYKYPL